MAAPRVFHMCGDFSIRTGGSLINAEIAETLRDRFGARVIHPPSPQWRGALGNATIRGIASNVILLWTQRFPRGSILVIDHGTARETFLAVWVWRWLYGCLIISTVYHLDFNLKPAGPLRWIRRLLERMSVAAGHVALAISQSGASQLRDLRGGDDGVFVMPVTRNFRPIVPIPERPVDASVVSFLFVGNVDQRKGIDLALQALAEYRGARRLRFVVVGLHDTDSAYAMRLRELEARLAGVEVTYMGRVDHAELERQFRGADAFLFPSRWEGYGIAVEEAMSFGLPVIAYAVGSIPELVQDGSTGWLLPAEDVASLANAIRACADDEVERQRRGRIGHERARELAAAGDPGGFVAQIVERLGASTGVASTPAQHAGRTI